MRMSFRFLGLLTAGLILPVAAALAQAPKLHDHSPQHGGRVLMSGDDHMEAVRSSDSEILIFLSDKFRKPLAPSLFKLEVQMATGEENIPFQFKKTEPTPPYATKIHFDTKLLKTESELRVRLPRVKVEKGNVSVDRWLKLPISQIPRPSREAPGPHPHSK